MDVRAKKIKMRKIAKLGLFNQANAQMRYSSVFLSGSEFGSKRPGKFGKDDICLNIEGAGYFL